jgi:hypothetical protein
MNSQTYQRQIRLAESSDQHLHFAAAYPTRLHADELWQSVCTALGQLGGTDSRILPRRKGPPQGLEPLFKQEFDFDPSAKADEVEGSVPQALLMMNNPIINQRIQARGTNLLARILRSYADDDAALRIVYLRTLARAPTEHESQKCKDFIAEAKNRGEAYEDILWALLNSAEFQTKR